MLPSVVIQKIDGQVGSTPPSDIGILAIIASAATGTANTPAMYTRDDIAFSDFGPAPLSEFGSYAMGQSGNPCVLERPTTSVPSTYGTIDSSHMSGSSVPTAGATAPADYYDVIVTFTVGGTVGSSGIQWTYSLDGGNSTSAPQALGTGSAPITLTIPNFARGGSPGVSFSMAAGTVVAGDYFRVLTAPALSNDSNLSTALEGLRVTTLPWEGVLIDQPIGTATVGLVDAWLTGLESVGKYRFAVLNTRLKNQTHVGSGTAETETAYATAMTTLVGGSATSIRLCVGTDGGNISSTLTGLVQPRPTSLFLAARAMKIGLGVEPAYVALGPLGEVQIGNPSNGAPTFHNEELYPNLDQLLLTTLRSLEGERGAFITNARVFSTVGSDYVLLPHIRTMNQGCEAAYARLRKNLSRGVGKRPIDPNTGKVYILESDAMAIEGDVNLAIDPVLKGQVNAYKFTLARDDDLSSQSGVIVHGSLAIVSLAYIKGFRVLAGFARSIAVKAAA